MAIKVAASPFGDNPHSSVRRDRRVRVRSVSTRVRFGSMHGFEFYGEAFARWLQEQNEGRPVRYEKAEPGDEQILPDREQRVAACRLRGSRPAEPRSHADVYR